MTNSILNDPSVNVGEIVLVDGIPTRRGFGGWFFMEKTEKGFRPIIVGNMIPGFHNEEQAINWITKGEE